MKKNDIGILFDVSGSMQSPLKRISENNSYKKSDELLSILEKICDKGHRLKNEQFRIFCIIFGGLNEPIYDFCNLLKITNKNFTHKLKSNLYDKASWFKNSYAQKFVKILSENGEKTLKLDKYLYCSSGPTERLCEMGCYLLENDRNLREVIYNSLPQECKSNIRNIGISVGNFISFGGFDNSINKSTTDTINDIYEKCIDKYISKIISEEVSRKKRKWK